MSTDLTTITRTLNALAALLHWLASRGVTRNESIALLDKAAIEGRDITSNEVNELLAKLDNELDETETLIDKSEG